MYALLIYTEINLRDWNNESGIVDLDLPLIFPLTFFSMHLYVSNT